MSVCYMQFATGYNCVLSLLRFQKQYNTLNLGVISMYQELLTWTDADPLVSPEALPEVVARSLSAALPRTVVAYLQGRPAPSVPPQKVKPHVNHEKISLATFVVALSIVAMQVGHS